MPSVKDIYSEIDRHAPFASAEKWDNCGILAGDPEQKVTGIVTCLDITKNVILEAEKTGAELIVSHHPVIFKPVSSVLADTPVGMLLKKNISAICVHTPFDMAPFGMNRGLYELLNKPLGLSPDSEPLEETGDGISIGKIYGMKEPLSPKECALRLKNALGCQYVRFTGGSGEISKIAVCSGSGGSLAELARMKGAQGLISGDFKHDVLIWAETCGFALFDCGHFHTERIFAGIMHDILSAAFPDVTVTAAESCTDPVSYV